MGALTQGDRRATGSANSLGLASFDMDNRYGRDALKNMYAAIWRCSPVSILGSDTDEAAAKLYVGFLKEIDQTLTEALDGDSDDWEQNLAGTEVSNKEEETRANFMYNLLAGPCRRLASDRVHAIRDGKSVAAFLESMRNGTESKEDIKPMVDEELRKAKEAGLNFNALCNIWLCK